MASNNDKVKIPVEIDITTRGSEQQIAKLFRDALESGKDFQHIFEEIEKVSEYTGNKINTAFGLGLSVNIKRAKELMSAFNGGDFQVLPVFKRLEAQLHAVARSYTEIDVASSKTRGLISGLETEFDIVRDRIDSVRYAEDEMAQSLLEFDAARDGVDSLTDNVETLDGAFRQAADAADEFFDQFDDLGSNGFIDSNSNFAERINDLTNRLRENLSKRESSRADASDWAIDTAGLSNFATAVSRLSSVFGNLSESGAAAELGIGGLSSAVAGVSGAVSSALPVISAVIVAFKALSTVVKGLWNVFKLLAKICIEVATAFGKLLLAELKSGYALVEQLVKGFSKLIPVIESVAKVSLSPLIGDLFDAQQQASGLEQAFTQLRSMLMYYFSARGLINIGKEALSLSSDIIEVQNVVDTVFGEMSTTIDDFASSVNETFGITSLNASHYASTFGGILQATGANIEDTTKIATNLTKLTADVASFYNLDHDEVFEKIQSGITGQVKPLRELGVSVTKANLEAYALANGITKSYESMNEAERTALRYNFIMESLSKSQGDFSRTSGSWANQVRQLSLQLQELASVVGNFLQKFLYPLLLVLNQILSFAITAGRALQKVFGATTEDLQIQQGLKGQDVGVTLADGMDDLADSTDDATDAQKKYNEEQKKSLANFHQLNILKSPDDSSSSSGGSGTSSAGLGGISFDLVDYLDIPDPDDEIDDLFNKVKNAIEEQDWEGLGSILSEKVNDVFSDLDTWIVEHTEPALSAVSDFVTFFNSFIKGLDTHLIGQTIADAGNLLVGVYNTFFDKVAWVQLGRQAGAAVTSFLDNFDSYELGRAFTQKFNAAFDLLAGFILDGGLDFTKVGTNLADFLKGAIDNIKTEEFRGSMRRLAVRIGEALKSAFSGLLEPIENEFNDDGSNKTYAQKLGERIADIVLGIIEFSVGIIANLPYDEISQVITQSVNSALAKLSDDQTLREFDDNLQSFAEGISTAINNIFDPENGINFTDAGTIVGSVLNSLVNAFNTFSDQTKFDEVGRGIADFLIAGLDAFNIGDLGTAVGNVIHDLGDALAGFVARLSEEDENGDSGWARIGKDLAAYFNNILAAIDAETLATGIAGLINGLTESLTLAIRGINESDQAGTLTTVINTVMDLVDWKSLKDLLLGYLEDACNWAVSILKSSEWESWWSDVWDVVWPIVGGVIKNGLSVLFSFLWEVLGSAIDMLLNPGKADWSAKWGPVGEVLYIALKCAIMAAFPFLGGFLFDLISGKIFDASEKDYSTSTDAVASSFGEDLQKSINSDLTARKPGLIESIGNWFGDLKTKVATWWDGLWSDKTATVTFNTNTTGSGGASVSTTSSAAKRSRAASIAEVEVASANVAMLAKGGVIPPNNQFLAVLGDQKRGINIETPLDTMIDAFKTALYDVAPDLGGVDTITIPVYVNSELSTEQIIRRQDMARYRSGGR